jgi:hypothetical protein
MKTSRLLIIIGAWELFMAVLLIMMGYPLAGVLALGISLQKILSAVEPQHSWPGVASGLGIRFGILLWLPWSGLEFYLMLLAGLESAVWIPPLWKLLK